MNKKGSNLLKMNEKILVAGNELWKKSFKNGIRRITFKGIIEKVDINPYSGKREVFIVSDRGSSYRLKKNLYVRIPGGH